MKIIYLNIVFKPKIQGCLKKHNSRTSDPLVKVNSTLSPTQGARNRRERQLTRFALPYDYTCFADGTPFYIELFGFFTGKICIGETGQRKLKRETILGFMYLLMGTFN